MMDLMVFCLSVSVFLLEQTGLSGFSIIIRVLLLRSGYMDNIIQPKTIPHTIFEDICALLFGTSLISFGMILLRQAGALTGSTAGIALLISYVTHISFGIVFFMINLPFYWIALRRMGKVFTLKTFCAIGLLSIFTDIHPLFVHFSALNPYYATLFGNVIIGVGFIILFRHKASLGGVNVVALWLQEQRGIRAGTFQMAVDCGVVIASLFVVSLPMLLVSIVGAVILNLIIAMNHRPGRYYV